MLTQLRINDFAVATLFLSKDFVLVPLPRSSTLWVERGRSGIIP